MRITVLATGAFLRPLYVVQAGGIVCFPLAGGTLQHTGGSTHFNTQARTHTRTDRGACTVFFMSKTKAGRKRINRGERDDRACTVRGGAASPSMLSQCEHTSTNSK